MTTFLDLINQTRQHLMTGQPDRLNVLATVMDATATTLSLTYENKGIADGSTIVIGIEEMHVLGTSTTGTTVSLNVIRGLNGSVPTPHAINDIIYVNPQFSSFRISQFVNQAFYNVSGDGLFRILNVNLPSNSVLMGYDTGALTQFIAPWRIRFSITGPSNYWPVLRHDQYYMDRQADTASFPSGTALFLREEVASGQDINLSYRAGFTTCINLDDDVLATTGLHNEAHDIPPIDAAIGLLTGREVKRSFLNRQPEPRRQEEVPPGAANQSIAALLNRYQDRIVQEKTRLKRLYPAST